MILLACLLVAASLQAQLAQTVRRGGVYVEDDQGNVLASWNADVPRVPASVMKLVTAAVVLDVLGPQTRIPTEFWFDDSTGGLCVRGGGDPFLVSESLSRAADSLAAAGISEVRVLVGESGLFCLSQDIPGRGTSLNPYDAPVSALAANFNTVVVTVTPEGEVRAGEPQTPLTPTARRVAVARGVRGTHRLPLQDGQTQAPRYALELLATFMRQRGITVGESLVVGPCGGGRLVYRHLSQCTVAEAVASMLEHSNNVVANTLLLTASSWAKTAPVDLADAQELLRSFLEDTLRLEGAVAVEGSGISRDNRLTPRQVVAVLQHLRRAGFLDLLPPYNEAKAKTGTLSGISCLAGFFPLQDGRTALFAILAEGAVGVRDRALRLLMDGLGARREPPQEAQGAGVIQGPHGPPMAP